MTTEPPSFQKRRFLQQDILRRGIMREHRGFMAGCQRGKKCCLFTAHLEWLIWSFSITVSFWYCDHISVDTILQSKWKDKHITVEKSMQLFISSTFYHLSFCKQEMSYMRWIWPQLALKCTRLVISNCH